MSIDLTHVWSFFLLCSLVEEKKMQRNITYHQACHDNNKDAEKYDDSIKSFLGPEFTGFVLALQHIFLSFIKQKQKQ